MDIIRVKTKPIDTNSYIIDNKFIIDPGKGIGKHLDESIKYDVLLTHGHFDHIIGLQEININKLYIHPEDSIMLKNSNENLSHYSEFEFSYDHKWYDITESFDILHTPGHTKGSCIIIFNNNLFTGDTIFCDNIGRTDFPHSNEDDMCNSLKNIVVFLTKNTTKYNIYPGHMNICNSDFLLSSNPYLRKL